MTTHPKVPPRPAASEAHGKRDARYLHLLNCNLFGIGVGDFEGNVLDANDALLRMFGSTREDLEAGKVCWKELTAPEYCELDERMLKQLRIDGICPPYEKEMLHRDGRRIPILLHLAVAPDNPECMVASIIDLTKQKQTEAALRLSEARFRLLVDGSQDYAFFMLDPTGHVVTWNASAERIKGFRADEIIGKHLSVFYLPEDVENGKPERELEEAAQGQDRSRGLAGPRRRHAILGPGDHESPCATAKAGCKGLPRSPRTSASAAGPTFFWPRPSTTSSTAWSRSASRAPSSRSTRRPNGCSATRSPRCWARTSRCCCPNRIGASTTPISPNTSAPASPRFSAWT